MRLGNGTDYQLRIHISEKDINAMKGSGLNITLVKVCDDSNHALATTLGIPSCDEIAWVACDLFQETTVSWKENYSVYASTTDIVSGATIDRMSSKQASPGVKEYTFSDGTFEEKSIPSGMPTAYYVQNAYTKKPSLTFGLAQVAKVSTGDTVESPINAMKVMAQNEAAFIPIVQLKVLLSAHVSNGKVISFVQSQAVVVDFTEHNEREITYDASLAKFRISDAWS